MALTHKERRMLIDKISIQFYQAKRIRRGVVLSYQTVEVLLVELRELQKLTGSSELPAVMME